MTWCRLTIQRAVSVNAAISFDLNAAAAYFERLGQTCVARSMRERAADLLAETARLQALVDDVLPILGDASRFPKVRSAATPAGYPSIASAAETAEFPPIAARKSNDAH
jgi:hypothetical protein